MEVKPTVQEDIKPTVSVEDFKYAPEVDDHYVLDYAAGRWLSSPDPDEEIVISGLAGKFPDSHNVEHFGSNLFNQVDMVSDDPRRWPHGHPEIPIRGGKLFDIEKFDTGFFGNHPRQSHNMDPANRLLLERSVEAIIDAGINPKELEGTKTGVFIGACFSESEKFHTDRLVTQTFPITGMSRSMLPHRLSYFLKLRGPSHTVDTACSSSLYALEHAYKAIRNGTCEQALVGGVNLCLHPFASLQFARLGVLSKDGSCKSFDNAGDGYARSEAVVVVLLQKAKDARRAYCRIVHAKTNCDGYKEQGITFPSSELQKRLMSEVYQECKINPADLSFLEAHGTGTKVGDPEEVESIDSVFCRNLRDRPLLVGSVKSNIGHSEPSSGLCSITKVILGMEHGIIPPNMHFKTPREECDALMKGRLQVVADKMPFRDDRGLIGVNSFGFGGGNCHVVLHWNEKVKVDQGRPKDDLPRLVCVSGRVESGIHLILDDIKGRQMDAEYIRLYHQIFREDIEAHYYRGYSIVTKSAGEIERSFRYSDIGSRPTLHLHFTCFSRWSALANDLYALPQFAASIQRIHNILSVQGINLKEIMFNGKKPTQQDGAINAILGVAAVQIGLFDILKSMEFSVNTVGGSSLGQFACAYADQTLTLEETIKCLYYVAMQAKGLSSNQLTSHFAKTRSQLLDGLGKIIPKSAKRSHKWLPASTTSLPSYFVDCLIGSNSPVEVSKDSVTLEVGDAMLEGPNCLSFASHNKNGFLVLLQLIGRLYQHGQNSDVSKLYPPVQYPVSRGTPMISHLFGWNHKHDWFVTKYGDQLTGTKEVMSFGYHVTEEQFQQLTGHVIDGRFLFPATSYLYMVWEVLAEVHSSIVEDMKVVFENCKFQRATPAPQTRVEFTVMLQVGSGIFEVSENNEIVVSGRATVFKSTQQEQISIPMESTNKTNSLPMLSKDIYKELRLRGYNYKGPFRALQKFDPQNNQGEIAWTRNWIAFLDNILQLKILQFDSRLLYVPVEIQRLSIDAPRHTSYCQSLGDNPVLPAYLSSDCSVVKSGFIELRGVLARSIPRRKSRGEPVLEKYEFVPNCADLTTAQSVRVNVQLILENLPGITVKVVEVWEEGEPEEFQPLATYILEALGDLPLIRPEITVLSKTPLELSNVKVEDDKLIVQTDCTLVVIKNVLNNAILLSQAFGALKTNGFVLSREAKSTSLKQRPDVDILTIHQTDNEQLVLIRKKMEMKSTKVISVSTADDKFPWLDDLKKSVKEDETLFILSQNEPTNGVLGLVNCIKRETPGNNIRGVFLVDKAPQFDLSSPFYKSHLDKNMAMNVYKNGQWGTYRHLLLDEVPEVEREHGYVNVLQKGDLTSLRWIEGPLNRNSQLEMGKEIVHVYCSGLNFRDIMTATGKINVDVITRDRTKQECVQGIEFAGRTNSGRRVMGLVNAGSMSTLVDADRGFLWDIPNEWTMEEAATVPAVYATVLYSFLVVAKIRPGQSILIHAGSGGIGQAAITIALHLGCVVYTTVGTKEKREFLLKHFPALKDDHIGNSRDISFEQMIHEQTHGHGVDLVLNSLAEDKLMASIRCLSVGGQFLEIGKFDLMKNSNLRLALFKKEGTFHGIMLDAFFNSVHPLNSTIKSVVLHYINNGVVKPLVRTVFKHNELEEAFRYMAGGKHIGKVVLQVRPEEEEKVVVPSLRLIKTVPRYICDPDKVHIVIGGLGGFGLELADWLILRGSRKIVLTSRTGITTGYQQYRTEIWKTYGTTVHISTADITTMSGCKKLLNEALELGPVESIFNLAVVLKDALFDNQNEENYQQSFMPKAIATKYLDKISRTMCPDLRTFVVFSSVSCGRGNAGQSNYGMANSVMERICERRRAEGLPALAIEWGAVGEVGLVAQMQDNDGQLEIGGTLQQPIASCIKVMDGLLFQDNPIVSSMVVAEKRRGAGGANNIVEAVANILGIKDIKTVSQHATLAELGMDSMSGVEIKQILEREFDVFLTPEDMRSMTFARLQEIQDEMQKDGGKLKKDRPVLGFDMILRLMNDEAKSKIPIIRLNSQIEDGATGPQVFLFPGVEGASKVFEPLANNLNAHVLSLQYAYDVVTEDAALMAQHLIKFLEPSLSKSKPFNIIGYSYGTIYAMEVVSLLETKGYTGQLICIDGAPHMLRTLMKNTLDMGSESYFQTGLICQVLSLHSPFEEVIKHKDNLLALKTFEERLRYCSGIIPNNTEYTVSFWMQFAKAAYKRINMLNTYEPHYPKIKTPTKLFKPTMLSVANLSDDYKLSELVENLETVTSYEGNHVTILQNLDLANAINETIGATETIAKKPVAENPTRIEVSQEETRQI